MSKLLFDEGVRSKLCSYDLLKKFSYTIVV